MVRQKSGEMATSPTPSLDSLNGVTLGSLCGDNVTSHLPPRPSSYEHYSDRSNGGSGSSPLSLTSRFGSSTKCGICSQTYSKPKVLPCFHTFCQGCLENIQDGGDKLTCPQCHTDTLLNGGGVSSLLMDYGISGILESPPGSESIMPMCTGCKSNESNAVAHCINCDNYLCPNCVSAHQYMHCFNGHHVTTLGEINKTGSKEGCGHQEMQELKSINHLVQESKQKVTEIRSSLKTLEVTSNRLSGQHQKAVSEVNETFNFYTSLLEERKSELLKELDGVSSGKQVSLSVYSQKAQDTLEKIHQIIEFVERLMKHATNSEVLLFKKLLENKLVSLLGYQPDFKLPNLADLEFVSNYQAIQAGVRNTFGYVRSGQEQNGNNCHGAIKQPPISRPTPSIPTTNNSTGSYDLGALGYGNGLSAPVDNKFSALDGMKLTGHDGLDLDLDGFDGGLLSKRFGSLVVGDVGGVGQNGGMVPNGIGPGYEKWSNGPDLYRQAAPVGTSLDDWAPLGPGGDVDLSSKLLCRPSATTSAAVQPLFPPKSQLKRQKMIYHCKFGEFGVLEGQFTEPSGVAVNAQNDIIVADTNNHRIQIFDKEGRFKFQFGECGKRDGQLLYPNRVAVVRTSGDIVVTERSPTHQIQIYNQYGQFVRKFGANILQHPRGVCVDSKGRIVVVECKVMRVIIFDQMGNVLNKFGCSKHLEFPNGVVVNDRNEIFVSDNRAHCVKVFDYEGNYLRQVGGEGLTNYPIGVGINSSGEITIADNHNNFNLTIFSQDGTLISALESKVKHAQCFDVSLMDDGSVVLASKDYRLYIYRYLQIPPAM